VQLLLLLLLLLGAQITIMKQITSKCSRRIQEITVEEGKRQRNKRKLRMIYPLVLPDVHSRKTFSEVKHPKSLVIVTKVEGLCKGLVVDKFQR